MTAYKATILIAIISLTIFSHHAYSTSILLLGDSLSASRGMAEKEGWVALLNQRLTQQKHSIKIINASISGETTAGGLSRLPNILNNRKFNYLLIELGANDGLRGFPPNLIKHNLLQIIKLAQRHKITVLLMNIHIPPNYGPRYSQLFTDIFQQLATENSIALLPFFMDKIAIKPSLMQNDGLHPNKKAQALIVKFMAQQLIMALKPKI